jgi:hypothetical protein
MFMGGRGEKKVKAGEKQMLRKLSKIKPIFSK